MTMWYDRLRSRMRERKITQDQMASRLNVSQSSVGHYLSGRRNPRKELLEAMADELEVSLDWLAGKSDTPPVDQRDFYNVPVLDVALAAGVGSTIDMELIEEYAPVSMEWINKMGFTPSELCVCYVTGDSMSPRLNDGDRVIINREDKIFESGKVYALAVDTELRVKRLVKRFDNAWLITSDNKNDPAYVDEVISHDMMDAVRVIGRVVLAITAI